MHYGVVMFPTEYSIAPDELARALEERGFESVWFPEHTHIPASRKSPWPGGGELPRDYWSAYDPFVALMAAAGATKRLKLGTGICLVIERDPITTAKEVATLDRLSGGRVLFGIGGGWNAEEMENHGTEWKSRWRLLRERVLAMKEIWTKREAEFHGEFVRFDKIWSDPKPRQKPHPPMIIGGDGARRSTASWSSATAGCRSCAATSTRWSASRSCGRASRRPAAIPRRRRSRSSSRRRRSGAGRARGGRRRARHLRAAVGAARRRAAAPRRLRRGDPELRATRRTPAGRIAASSC